MPPKRSRYEVDEYVPVTNTPTVDSEPITRQHTQYEMSDASHTSRVKTVLNIEHEESPTILTDAHHAALTEELDIPDLVPMDDEDLSDDEGPDDDGQGDLGFDNDIDRELEAAGLGNICAPKPVKSRRIRNTHTVSCTFICQFHSY